MGKDCIYAMGSEAKLTKNDCSYVALAEEILRLKYTKEENIDVISKEDIRAEAKELSVIFYRKDGGYLQQIKKYLKIDLELYSSDNLQFQREKFKILYLFYYLKQEYCPKTKVIELLGKPSMESIDNSQLGWNTYYGDITGFVKGELEKELGTQAVANIKEAVKYIVTEWDSLLDNFRFQIDYICSQGDKCDVDKIINLLDSDSSEIAINTIPVFMDSSPIEMLYLRMLQFEQIGQIKDILLINSIEADSNYDVPPDMIEEMKMLYKKKIKYDNIEKYIDENTDKIAKCVYVRNDVSKNERKTIHYHKGKIVKLIDFCVRARPLYTIKNEIDELFIISCFQAILLDSRNQKFEYIFHGYQNFMKHEPQVQGALMEDKETIDALKIYWVRKVIDHFYANIGRYDVRCELRRLENACDNVLIKILSCDDISSMLAKHSFFYNRITRFS